MTTNFTPVLYRACALTQGYTLDCNEGMGGAGPLWLIEYANVSGTTFANGIVTAIGKANNKRFWKYEQKRNTCQAKEELQKNIENGTTFWNQTIDLALIKLQASVRNEITLLVQNRLIAVVKDKNGKYWMYGRNDGLELATGKGDTGKAAADRNGYDLQLTAEEKDMALEVQESVIATIETI